MRRGSDQRMMMTSQAAQEGDRAEDNRGQETPVEVSCDEEIATRDRDRGKDTGREIERERE